MFVPHLRRSQNLSGCRRLLSVAPGLLLLAANVSPGLCEEAPKYPVQPVDWATHQKGAKDSLNVYWVGHSLMEAKAETQDGEISLLSLVGLFAEAKGHSYKMGDHTLWGTSLSAFWRGEAHSYERNAPEMLKKREKFQKEAAQYDAMVLTEGIPVSLALKNEYSSYYLQNFYCTLMNANAEARVYLYEGWVHLHGSDRQMGYAPAAQFDWRARMISERKAWEQLADEATRALVPKPDWVSRSKARLGYIYPACKSDTPIFLLPAGSALVKLYDRLQAPREDDDFVLPNGEPFSFPLLFRNAYKDWPKEWPLDDKTGKPVAEQLVISKLSLHAPSADPDDVHPSAIGIYFVSLVHYATLYRQNPIGLPAFSFVGEGLARTLQCIAWETVVNEPRTGVRGDKDC